MKTQQDIIGWLTQKVAQEAQTRPENVSIETPFTGFGLDSIVVVTLVADLERWLGIPLDPTVCWEYPTIQRLSEWLVQERLGV